VSFTCLLAVWFNFKVKSNKNSQQLLVIGSFYLLKKYG